MTADEPMSTPDSGGLREAMRRLLDDEVANLADDGARLSHAVVRRMEAVLAAHSEPVPTPDSADDATAGERECPTCGICSCSAAFGYHRRMAECATPPADDANRAPVSGGLDEGVRRKWANAEQAVRKAEHHFPADCLAEAIEVASRLAERLAAVEAERDYAKASQAETWGYVCEIAQTLGIEPDDGHPMDVVDRMTARAEAAEAERDTARREAGERITAAKVEALRDAAQALNREGLSFKPGGWGSNPADQQTIDVMVKAVRWLRARADALTSDDGSGA